MSRPNFRKRFRMPYWLPLTLLTILLIGSIINNIQLNGNWKDFVLIATFTMVIILFYIRAPSAPLYQIDNEPYKFSLILGITTLVCSTIYYVSAGVPLLADDPNTARMEFMASTWLYKLIKVYIPFTIIYFTASLPSARNKKWIITTIFLLILVQIMSGGKGAAIWIAVFLALGYGASGRSIRAFAALKWGLALLIPTIILFRHIQALESWSETLIFLLNRLTGIAEYGLFIVTNPLEGQIEWTMPLHFVTDIFLKLSGEVDNPYTLSFGRRITAAYYGGDPYSYIWELTVTAISDIYTIFNTWLYLPAVLCYSLTFKYIDKRTRRTKSLYTRCGFFTIWLHSSLYILTGSIATEVAVRTIPFLIFWSAGYLILKIFKKNNSSKV